MILDSLREEGGVNEEELGRPPAWGDEVPLPNNLREIATSVRDHEKPDAKFELWVDGIHLLIEKDDRLKGEREAL